MPAKRPFLPPLFVVLLGTLMCLPVSPRSVADDASAEASSAAEMKPYKQEIPGTPVSFEMVPIPGGTVTIGSPDDEAERADDEGPRREIQIEPFWMGKHEVTWDEFDLWTFNLDIERRKVTGEAPTERDLIADAVTRPTKPYTDMTFGMGKNGYPAICMTQLAAKMYCKWLSAKTGHYYRLPTEAEWEYACRAGTSTAYSFGDDPGELDDYAWYYDNANDQYQKVGKKKPNPWGLYDIHGNVAEWCLDQYDEGRYEQLTDGATALEAYLEPTTLYPRVARGGSWDDDPDMLRSAARRGSDKSWKIQDPQIPQSRWYHTDAIFVGFRLVRPLVEADDATKVRYRAEGTDDP